MNGTARKLRARWVVVTVAVMSALFNAGPASGTVLTATGSTHGIESRDAQSTFTPPSTLNLGYMCTDDIGEPWDTLDANPFGNTFKVTGKSSYKYTLDNPTATPDVGVASIRGRPSSGPDQTYEGRVYVEWEANEVWDGPLGTTRPAPNATGECAYGYQWRIDSATIRGDDGSDANTLPDLECTNATPGASQDFNLSNSGSFFSREIVSSTHLDPSASGQAVVRLVFPAGNCKINNVTINHNGSPNVFTLVDRAHAFCADLNAVEAAALGDAGNEVGVTHCVANYVFES